MNKVPCLRCKEDILPTTFEKTGGYCMPCWRLVEEENEIKDLLDISRESQSFARQSYKNRDLTDIKLTGLDLGGSIFEDCNLAEARLWSCKLTSARFHRCTMDGARMWSAFADNADFSESSMCKLESNDSTFKHAKFNQVDLTGASFLRDDLSGADFGKANLTDTKFSNCKFSEMIVFPPTFFDFSALKWKGKGRNPIEEQLKALCAQVKCGALDDFVVQLRTYVNGSKINRSIEMLRKESFQLFSELDDGKLSGVVKSQTDPDLVYACSLTSEGKFCCCTQNLKACGGLQGSLCKHLLVLMIGLARSGALDYKQGLGWCIFSRATLPKLDKDAMASLFLKYKGTEAGEIDWRPIETMPEDYYAF